MGAMKQTPSAIPSQFAKQAKDNESLWHPEEERGKNESNPQRPPARACINPMHRIDLPHPRHHTAQTRFWGLLGRPHPHSLMGSKLKKAPTLIQHPSEQTVTTGELRLPHEVGEITRPPVLNKLHSRARIQSMHTQLLRQL